ncbi:MAG: TlyA family RNA methyltransferase [Finegoldia sp.]|nr:TlyA family RNA methyltransferase [Finegoldia sp.]
MKRVDLALVEMGLADSRNKAQDLIEKDCVLYKGEVVKKNSKLVDETCLEVKDHKTYVGRGAFKLERAFDVFDIKNKDVCLDIGSSTGGFTQVLLENGARKVYAIDVGDKQMDDRLRYDERVILHENTNFRDIDTNAYPKFNLIVGDLSFISLKLIIPNAIQMLDDLGQMILLIKPQFESKLKDHIIKNKKEHIKIIKGIEDFSKDRGLYINDLTFSPIKGKKGNIEYLALFSFNEKSRLDIDRLVNDSFEYFS